jgi:glycosyltransferase involved in cell wall biosynthesis
MTERGYRIIIAAPEKSIIFRRAKDAGIDTFPAHFQKKNPVSVLKLISLINRKRPDVVNTHSSSDSWATTIAAKLSGAKPKIIRTRHLSTPISRSYLSRLIYDILPDAVITTGEEIRLRMIHYNGFDASKIYSIPTGVDLQRFNPSEVKPILKHEGFSIGMIGVLRSWKGHRFFIDAVPRILSEIPDATFYIVGEGYQRGNIQKRLLELSLQEKVFMLGHREDIPEILKSLDVIVQPSYAHEGIPQAVLQAMAMRKPVVASDIGVIKEIVIDRATGFLIESKNSEQIAEKVIELYKNPDLRTTLGREGRRLVEEKYSIEKMLDNVEALYEKLLH